MLSTVAGSQRAGLSELARALSTSARAAADVVAAEEGSIFKRFADPVPQVTEHSSSLSYIQPTKVTTLSNGLRVATEAMPHTSTATVGMWIDAGSRYETDENNGTAHFLEHLLFKGTTSRTGHSLEVEIEDMGAHLNAYTSRESTVYFAKSLAKDSGRTLELLADILQNSNLDSAAIERERSVIMREMQEIEGMPQEVVFDHLHATAFQHSPLARTILGPAANIQSITRDHLTNYIKTHYTAPRMVIVGAGDVDHDALCKQCETLFSGLPTGGPAASELVTASPSKYTGSDVRIREPDMETVHLAVAFEGASYTDADSIPLMVMQAMLGTYDAAANIGGNQGSELAQQVHLNGLADSFMAFNTNYHDTGLWGVYASGHKSKMEDLGYVLQQSMTKLVYEPSEADVTRAKNQLKSTFLGINSSTQFVADEIGRAVLQYGRRPSRSEMLARIDAVNADTVRAVADRFLYDQDPVIAAMGDTQDLPDYNSFRRGTYWLRY